MLSKFWLIYKCHNNYKHKLYDTYEGIVIHEKIWHAHFVIGSECAKCIHLECPIQIVTGPGMDKMVFV